MEIAVSFRQLNRQIALSYSAYSDIRESLSHPHLWWWTAIQDIRSRYRRSMLGPWWLTISTGIMIAAMGFLYAGIFKTSINEYLPHFAVGQVFWVFFSGQLGESTTGFTQFEGILKQARLPLSACVLRIAVRHLVILAHNIVIVAIVFLAFQIKLVANFLWFFPAFAILLAAMISTSLSIAILCTRFRDLAQIVTSVLQILFFLSPIFWKPSVLGDGALLVKLNPVYYLLEVVREPLFGRTPDGALWIGAIMVTAILIVVAGMLFHKFRNRLTYWL